MIIGDPVLQVAGTRKTIGAFTVPISSGAAGEVFSGITFPSNLIAIVLITKDVAIMIGNTAGTCTCPIPANTGIYLPCDGKNIYAISQGAATTLGYIIISET